MNQTELYQWIGTMSKGWSGFSRHFKENLEVFSRGIARAQSSHIRRIAGCVEGKSESQRRRLQRFLKQEVRMAAFFKEWSATIIATTKQKTVTLIVDETKQLDEFGEMVVGLAYKGRCIPLAWQIYRAKDKASYPDEGQVGMILKLLAMVKAGIEDDVTVCVLADRGIGTSPDLMRGIMEMKWNFLFRVTKMSKIVLDDGQEVTFYDQVTQAGDSYHASGKVFKKRGLVPAHVRVLWGTKAKEAWALVTNDPCLSGWEYGNRMWVEESFRDLKSYGWRLEQSHFTCPQRLERFWILLVVAYAWLLLWGDALEQARLTIYPHQSHQHKSGKLTRRWSLFREGWLAFLTFHPSPKT